jgi:electron transport complex protein RnfB
VPDNSAVNAPNTTRPGSALFSRIHAALPQTQCTRCGYPDCAAYADAIAADAADINQCPPGGHEGIARLAAITGHPATAVNPDNGSEGPRSVAVIDEQWCIGCTLCLDACPTDAIMGSNKMMHTVIEPYCTGCELCVPACPVDCISLENASGDRTGWNAWSQAEANQALGRYKFHSYRRLETADEGMETPVNNGGEAPASLVKLPTRAETDAAGADRRRSVIEAALARARLLASGRGKILP